MYKIEVIDADEFSEEIKDNFDSLLGTIVAPKDQDYVQWPLVLDSNKRKFLDDDQWEAFRNVTDYILDKLDEAQMDDGEIEFVLVNNF